MARETLSHARVACEGPGPTVRGDVFCRDRSGYRSAGACPPRSSGRPEHGEGQALALRCGWRFFHRSAGAPALREGAAFFPHREAYHLNVEQFMKHPHFMWRQQDEILDAFVSRPLADK